MTALGTKLTFAASGRTSAYDTKTDMALCQSAILFWDPQLTFGPDRCEQLYQSSLQEVHFCCGNVSATSTAIRLAQPATITATL